MQNNISTKVDQLLECQNIPTFQMSKETNYSNVKRDQLSVGLKSRNMSFWIEYKNLMLVQLVYKCRNYWIITLVFCLFNNSQDFSQVKFNKSQHITITINYGNKLL